MWYSVLMNIKNVRLKKRRASVIEMPDSSKYAGYTFYHPNKLIRQGKRPYTVYMSFEDNFVFHINKYSFEDKAIVDTVTLTGKEMKDEWRNEKV